jgi:V-type H+-transporting ATPase subunit E
MEKLNIDAKIVYSQKQNETRLKKLTVRSQQLERVRGDIKERIKTDLAPDTDKYRDTVKDMIVQGMIRLIEEEVELKVREGEQDLINGMLEECQESYASIMKEATLNDYECKLSVNENVFLKEEEGAEYGGVMMYAHKGKIVVSNTLLDRVNLVFEQALPGIRQILFNEQQRKTK